MSRGRSVWKERPTLDYRTSDFSHNSAVSSLAFLLTSMPFLLFQIDVQLQSWPSRRICCLHELSLPWVFSFAFPAANVCYTAYRSYSPKSFGPQAHCRSYEIRRLNEAEEAWGPALTRLGCGVCGLHEAAPHRHPSPIHDILRDPIHVPCVSIAHLDEISRCVPSTHATNPVGLAIETDCHARYAALREETGTWSEPRSTRFLNTNCHHVQSRGTRLHECRGESLEV
jgi:hypothetical protein